MIQKLLDEHERIREHARFLLAVVSSDPFPSAAQLEEARWALARKSLQHLAADERLVLARIEQDGTDAEQLVAAEFRHDLELFNQAFREHMEHWTGRRVSGDRKRYIRSVTELVTRLEDRLEREERDLYPIAQRIDSGPARSPKRNWAGDAWSIRESIAS